MELTTPVSPPNQRAPNHHETGAPCDGFQPKPSLLAVLVGCEVGPAGDLGIAPSGTTREPGASQKMLEAWFAFKIIQRKSNRKPLPF